METKDKAGAGERKKSDNGNDYGKSGCSCRWCCGCCDERGLLKRDGDGDSEGDVYDDDEAWYKNRSGGGHGGGGK